MFLQGKWGLFASGSVLLSVLPSCGTLSCPRESLELSIDLERNEVRSCAELVVNYTLTNKGRRAVLCLEPSAASLTLFGIPASEADQSKAFGYNEWYEWYTTVRPNQPLVRPERVWALIPLVQPIPTPVTIRPRESRAGLIALTEKEGWEAISLVGHPVPFILPEGEYLLTAFYYGYEDDCEEWVHGADWEGGLLSNGVSFIVRSNSSDNEVDQRPSVIPGPPTATGETPQSRQEKNE